LASYIDEKRFEILCTKKFCPSFTLKGLKREVVSSTAFEVAAAKCRRVVSIRFLIAYRTEEQDEIFIPIRQFET
jgi:hypothetical protein